MTIAALVAIVGLLIYALAAGKAQEVGRIMFFTGLLILLLRIGSQGLAFLR